SKPVGWSSRSMKYVVGALRVSTTSSPRSRMASGVGAIPGELSQPARAQDNNRAAWRAGRRTDNMKDSPGDNTTTYWLAAFSVLCVDAAGPPWQRCRQEP